MSEVPKVTNQLLSAPLPQIIERLGIAIAEAQTALDRNSIAVAQAMAETEIELGGETTNLIALGFTPTFYSFTEATVEAKLSFSMQETTELGVSVGASVSGGAGFVMVAASVNVSYARKFSVGAEGMSSIAARLVSLPPPELLEARLKTMSEKAPT
ncbi:MAG: hypothetical protein B7Y35_09470 [Sphingomonadales bacterium 28-64-96]|jgi:hypothetical protein|uniref:hypothetical protein n=1 Tax=Sandarakinorhabdus sp. TaxID=1916663 RepID=UPI000BD3C5D8|nr:hypothetical protein [Sandarakinorhabdus sp.]OYZ14023.1 MAG: hypothetical protein B7Y35_09470 [Sphingomonadales bacterium 28-64-96]